MVSRATRSSFKVG